MKAHRSPGVGHAALAQVVIVVTSLVVSPPSAAGATAQDSTAHSDHPQHSHPMHHTADPAPPSETGEAAFAGLAEMVARLDADPATDWERVSIRALRDHLVDMHRLVTEAVVDERPVPGGFTARVTGTGPTRDAIQRMLPAHGRMLTALGYEAEVETSSEGATLTVREGGPEPAPGRVARLRGLGFYGVMTLGDHHRSHHLAMATGQPMTGHGGGMIHPSN